MKVSVSSYSFSQYINRGKLTQFEVVAKAKELGFDAVEFTDLTPPEGVSEEEFAVKIKEECDRCGLPVSSYTVGADFLKEDVEKEIARVKKKADIAKILGAPVMRHDASYSTPKTPEGLTNVLDKLAAAIREVSQYAETLGIKTMVENHGFFLQDADRVERLINAVGHANFGWLCDMGNFLCADEKPEISCGKAAPYAFYVHAKDFIVKNGNAADPGEGFFTSRAGNYLRGTIVGHGNVPVLQCLKVLKKSGYDGYVSLEFEGMEDCAEGLRIGLKNVRGYLTQIENI